MILFYLIYQCYASSADYDAARSNALTAFYKQSGWETDVNKYAKTMDEKYVPDEVNKNAAPILILLEYVNNHEISWRWHF